MNLVFAVHEDQHRDRFRLGIDDPVLRDAALGVFGALLYEIALAILAIRTDDFKDHIRAVRRLQGVWKAIERHELHVRLADQPTAEANLSSRQRRMAQLSRTDVLL